jgi:hypothetical protein
LHRQRRPRHEAVVRKHNQDGAEHLRRAAPRVQEHPARMGGSRKIGVGQRHLVAMAHAGQCMEQVGRQQRGKAL